MHRIAVLAFTLAISALASASGALAADVCYETKVVPASWACQGTDSNSADFVNGCTFVGEHLAEVEAECPKGKWVNITKTTKQSESGVAVTHAQACAAAGLVPYSINGKTCASGERPARVGNGWELINYKYGLKGGGNGNDGGDKLMSYTRDAARNPAMHYGNCSSCSGPAPAPRYITGTMCYDNSMGERNNTQQDAAIAVYCQ
jgi:hypothetical protein